MEIQVACLTTAQDLVLRCAEERSISPALLWDNDSLIFDFLLI